VPDARAPLRHSISPAMSPTVLEEDSWIPMRAAHVARVAPWIGPRLERMARGERHPVDDFLFEYYPHRPSHLQRWHPGAGTILAGPRAAEYLAFPFYEENNRGVTASPLPPKRLAFLEWLTRFLEATASRPPFFGCHGLHEWAMVHRTADVRHAMLPLRLDPVTIASVVESLPVRCSHYDAFRFFTPAAAPLNSLQPTRETSIDHEQPGCLHANMDLYKWCFKLAPWIPSRLTADAFELARDVRTLDMRATPYDLTGLGLPPVRIEEREGRREYEQAQRTFAERSAPIRAELLEWCRRLAGENSPKDAATPSME
jgi:hypothetical protein